MEPINFKDFESLQGAKNQISILEHQFKNGGGLAGYWLGCIYSEDNTFVPHEIKIAIGASTDKAIDYSIKSFDLLTKEANAGNGESMHLVALYYQVGMPPVSRNRYLFKQWTDKAADAGYVVLEDLLAIYGDRKSEFYDPDKARTLRERL